MSLSNCYAQNINYNQIDQRSNHYFQNNDLDSLEFLRNQSIANELDCYIIRLRLGILYFNQKKYIIAQREFKEALKFNSYDTLLFEYLYYCNVYLSKLNEAQFEAQNYPPLLKNKIGLRKTTLIRNLEFNFGYFNDATQDINIPSNYKTKSKNTNTPILLPPNPSTETVFDLMIQNKNQDMKFYNITLRSTLSSRLNVINSFGKYILNKQSIFKANGSEYSFNSTLQQNDFASTIAILINKKISLGLSYHFSSLQFISYTPLFDNFKKQYSFNSNAVKEINHVFYSSLKYNLNRGWIEPSLSVSSINKDIINQLNTGIFIYPFSGNRIYLNTTLSGIIDNTGKHFVFNPKLGVNIGKRITLENAYYWGSLMNYNENGAQILYNLADDIRFKGAANVFIKINKHLQIGFYGSILKRETNYTIYNLLLQEEIRNLNYYQKTITGGIIWNY